MSKEILEIYEREMRGVRAGPASQWSDRQVDEDQKMLFKLTEGHPEGRRALVRMMFALAVAARVVASSMRTLKMYDQVANAELAAEEEA